MAEEVFIPKYGQTVEEVTIVQWMADDGAPVKKGQELLEIETDKTTFMVEAEAAGSLHRGPYGEQSSVLTMSLRSSASRMRSSAHARLRFGGRAGRSRFGRRPSWRQNDRNLGNQG
jgi:hypothetical protein